MPSKHMKKESVPTKATAVKQKPDGGEGEKNDESDKTSQKQTQAESHNQTDRKQVVTEDVSSLDKITTVENEEIGKKPTATGKKKVDEADRMQGRGKTDEKAPNEETKDGSSQTIRAINKTSSIKIKQSSDEPPVAVAQKNTGKGRL
jgi:hypothetical protein